jgi:hypothetical protein
VCVCVRVRARITWDALKEGKHARTRARTHTHLSPRRRDTADSCQGLPERLGFKNVGLGFRVNMDPERDRVTSVRGGVDARLRFTV